jgi:CubicO group peptidase (beta-lactamase class C family)
VFGHYGFQWWLEDAPSGRPMFSAVGHDGQYIHVIPELDLVIVRNGMYFKFDGEPVADPSLWERLPSGGMVVGLGTLEPDSWSLVEFIGGIEGAVLD